MGLVKLDVSDQLAVVTLNNPPVNAVSMRLIDDFHRVIDDILAANVRAVVTRSDATLFCAGADVSVFHQKNAQQARRDLAGGLELIRRFELLPIPTIVEIGGMCVAAGCEFLLMHDMAFASQDAQIGQIEAQIGTSTLLGGVQRLAARCGSARAAEMVFTGEVYPAPVMADWGVINGVFPPQELRGKVTKMAERLAQGPTAAHGVTKSALAAYCDNGLAAADRVMLEVAPRLLETDDMQAGVSAFLEGGVGSLGHVQFKGR